MVVLAALFTTLAAQAWSTPTVVLVPVDNRPAVGQFPEMMAAMADVDVVKPHPTYLGQFLRPGSPEAILTWLESRDLTGAEALVVSTDMIAYGGLIASRANATSYETALNRLQRLVRLRKKWPNLKIYGFSAVMRITPTATRITAPWRLELARYMEMLEKYPNPSPETQKVLNKLKSKVPPQELRKYLVSRKRNYKIQRMLVKMAATGGFDCLLIGQDDATPYGPQMQETRSLKKLIATSEVSHKVMFCEGIDQHAAVLMSRAVLSRARWTPRVRIVYSDPSTSGVVARYESKPLSMSLKDQIVASGARLAYETSDSDYTLYVNSPKPKMFQFSQFIEHLGREVDMGMPVAVADVNLGRDSTCDPALFDALWKNGRMMRLLSFAGWNSAGNTMGTSIPAANIYLLARRVNVDPLKREIAQREFLLHRFVNDYAYHKFTRPGAYNLLTTKSTPKEEVYGTTYSEVTDFVKRDLSKYLDKYFREQFLGRTFYAGAQSYVVSGIDEVDISLPWPRAYEVSLHFRLKTQLSRP